MKKIVMVVSLAVFVFTGTAVFGQKNPLLGEWDFQMVFIPEKYLFEFKADGTYTVQEPGYGEPEQWEYYLHEQEPIVTLEMSENQIMDWRYELPANSPDVLFFFLADGNDWFVEQFTHAIFEIEGAETNDLTADFVESLVEAINEVFKKEAFMKGIRQQ